MRRLRAYRMEPAIARYEARPSIPALQRAHVDAGRLAGQAQPCAGLVRGVDIMSQRTVLATQFALKFLDATPVLLRLLWAGTRLLGLSQRLRGALPPGSQLLRVQTVGAAPCAPGSLIHRSGRQHGVESGRRCPGPLASGPGQRITAPALQRPHSHANLTCNVFQRRALRRQQPCNRSVLECLSVFCQFAFSSSPPVYRLYWSDKYSDAGGARLVV